MRTPKFYYAIALHCLMLVYSSSGFSLEQSALGNLPYLDSQVIVDGKLNEAAWQNALRVDLNFETQPGENIPSEINTTAFLFENNESLFVAFEAQDPNPELIRAFLADRDNIWDSDLVSIKLDTFNSGQQAYQFFVTPLGNQGDIKIDDSHSLTDITWDAIWNSSGQITNTGFTVEIEIPLKSLRFDQKPGIKVWGVELTRVLRRGVIKRYSSQAKIRGLDCDVCRLRPLKGFSELKSSGNFMLIPSLIVSSSKERRFNTLSNTYSAWEDANEQERLSMDLRWGVNEGTIVNATLNPDYSQIEADSFQLDVNTLNVLSLEEKRAFFLEGNDYFNHWSNLFYSRIFEEPEYGVKYTTTVNEHSLGVLALKDKHTNYIIPYSQGAYLQTNDQLSSNNLVARYRYDLGGKSNVGMTYTQRSSQDYENQVFGVDGKYWISDVDYFRFQSFWSDSDYPDEVVSEFAGEMNGAVPLITDQMSGNAVALNYTHAGPAWQWYSSYHYFEQGFRADTGLIGVSNWERVRAGVTHNWYADDPESWWSSGSVVATGENAEEILGVDLYEQMNLNFEISGVYESTFGLDNRIKTEHFNGLSFSRDSTILWMVFKPFSSLEFSSEIEQSDAIYYQQSRTGSTFTTQITAKTYFSKQLSAEVAHISQDFDLPAEALYEFKVTNLNLAYQINEKSFLRLIWQQRKLDYFNDQSAASKTIGRQLLYSYKVNPFTLFFLGYSDAGENWQVQRSPQLTDKTLFAKFSYAWQQ